MEFPIDPFQLLSKTPKTICGRQNFRETQSAEKSQADVVPDRSDVVVPQEAGTFWVAADQLLDGIIHTAYFVLS